jgi:Tfp pilus assembly protein FimV
MSDQEANAIETRGEAHEDRKKQNWYTVLSAVGVVASVSLALMGFERDSADRAQKATDGATAAAVAAALAARTMSDSVQELQSNQYRMQSELDRNTQAIGHLTRQFDRTFRPADGVR